MREADGHTMHFLWSTQKLPCLGQDSGRWDGVKLKKPSSSTCYLRASEKHRVDRGENRINITVRVSKQGDSVKDRDYRVGMG